MLRIAVISSLFLAGCDVGSIPEAGSGDGGNNGSDGGGSAVCETISASPPDGHHNEGMGCRSTGACHNLQLGLGAGAPEFSIAGTIYKDTAGTTAYAGATVFVTIGGSEKKTISATNGNFWFVPALVAAPSNTATGMTRVSACPNTTPMGGALVNGGGDCNNCHRAAGGTTLPVYVLP